MALDSASAAGDTASAAAGHPEPTADLWSRVRLWLIVALGLAWLAFQFAIVAEPQDPLLSRPIHLVFALALTFLTLPLDSRQHSTLRRAADVLMVAAVFATGCYYWLAFPRLTGRIEMVDPVTTADGFFGLLLLLLLLEGVRRTVGWALLGLLLFVLFYSAAGAWFPGWLRFRGFGLEETVEMMTMTTNGVLGITTETSVQFVFYFIAFGAIYAAIGGGKLFIDIGLSLSGRHSGGAAKAAVLSSSLMGTVSGSAVANVVSVGVFTIPLMRRAGYKPAAAAGIEAIASTGGQLMPPVMGVAAFVMAEMLQIDYGRIAWAAVIPAVAFYLNARRTGIGTLKAGSALTYEPLLPRLYLLLPPLVLIALLTSRFSATFAVNAAIFACVVTCYLRRRSWLGPRAWLSAIHDVARQASHVAVPIAAIGIIIAVAIQSNLALKFSTRLIEAGGANVYAALLLTVLGCLVMGLGLPTVAAYIIGAILFVPSLLKLGVPALSAHFFVMYYCVLSMVTPPVALASFAAAGLARAGTMDTSWQAFRLSFVLFLIPFGFVFDLRLLGQGEPLWVAAAFLSLLTATAVWAVSLTGYLGRPLTWLERVMHGAAAVLIILFPTGSRYWAFSLALAAMLACWSLVRWRLAARHREVL